MEFPDAGAHCHLESCRTLDFLPYTCPRCKHSFCDEHKLPKDHECPEEDRSDFVTCPICNEKLRVFEGEDPGTKVSAHIDLGCDSVQDANLRELADNTRCQYGRCKKSEFMPITCKRCHKNFCVDHRNELSHKCNGSARKCSEPVDLSGVKKALPVTARDKAKAEQERQLREARARMSERHAKEATHRASSADHSQRPPPDDACCALM